MKKTTEPAKAPAPIDQDALTIKQLAKGVLARDFRPRVGSIRRLAEAALASQSKPKSSGKKKKKKSSKGTSKKRKLARIPGQKKGK